MTSLPSLVRQERTVRFDRRTSALLAAVTIGLTPFATACTDLADESPADVETIEAAHKEVTVPISAVTAVLIDPGEEPREKLGPRLTPGVKQYVTLCTDNRISQQIDNQPEKDFSTPGLSIPLIAAAGPDGIDLTVGKVSTPDAQLSSALAPADGTEAGLRMSPLGAFTALRLSPAPQASNVARSALERAFYQAVYQAIAFPDAPIGVGATWTISQQVSPGIQLDQVTTATLTGRDGNLLDISVDVRQTPKASVWNLPGGAGVLNIDDYDMRGAGDITVDLGLPLPVRGTVTVGGQQIYSDPTSTTTLRQTISNQVRWGE